MQEDVYIGYTASFSTWRSYCLQVYNRYCFAYFIIFSVILMQTLFRNLLICLLLTKRSYFVENFCSATVAF